MRKPLMQLLAIRLSEQTAPTQSLVRVKRPDLPIAPIAASDHSTGGTAGKLRNSPVPRKLMLQLLGITAGLTLSAWGHAVGLGGINVVSGLGQPLKAEIELVAVSRTDKPGLVARLASPDAYKGAGLDYPSGVKYSFEVGSRANGEPYLKLTSNREINDPFVSLLVELSWSSGKLMREYTFLLDPPGYVPAQPAAAAVQAVAPEVVQSAPLNAPVENPEQVRQLARPVESAAKPVERPIAKPVEKPSVRAERSASVSTGAITVKQGDTLNVLAAGIKPDDVSLERMLVALYRANAEQFDGKNMNRIRTGKILRVPDHDEVINVTQVEASQEIHAQTADWNAYRQKLAGAATASRQTEDARHVATGKITAPVADKTPVASESAKEVLRLSKGGTPGDKAGAAGRSRAEQRNAAAEDAIAKAKAVEEGKTRAALLESNLKDMQRLAQLKSEAAALVASAAASKVADIPASAVVAASSVAAASEAVSPVVASQVAAASAVKPADAEEASLPDRLMQLLDKLLASPVALALGAAALLALAGLGLVLKRRRKAPESAAKPAGDEFDSTTGHLATPVTPSPDTGDFTAIQAEEAAPHPDDVDPISEADLFLNFGRDEQAEEVLKDALLHSPGNHQVHLKLLGIYANRQDADAFAKVADLLEKTGDVDAIRQAEVLARKMQPVKASIEDAASATTLIAAVNPDAEPDMASDEASIAQDLSDSEAAGEELPAPVEAIDFDVTSTVPALSEAVDFDVTSVLPEESDEVDFDVTSTSPVLVVPEALDFDIAAKEPATADQQEEEALPSLDDLIFDVMPAAASEAKAEVVAESSAEKTSEEDDGMEFTLDFPLDDVTEKFTPPAPAINLSDISLDMDDVSAPAAEPAAVEKSEHWHEVATKLDLAKAYQEMGDEVGAREILEEVMREGDEAQQQEAQLFIKQLG